MEIYALKIFIGLVIVILVLLAGIGVGMIISYLDKRQMNKFKDNLIVHMALIDRWCAGYPHVVATVEHIRQYILDDHEPPSAFRDKIRGIQ